MQCISSSEDLKTVPHCSWGTTQSTQHSCTLGVNVTSAGECYICYSVRHHHPTTGLAFATACWNLSVNLRKTLWLAAWLRNIERWSAPVHSSAGRFFFDNLIKMTLPRRCGYDSSNDRLKKCLDTCPDWTVAISQVALPWLDSFNIFSGWFYDNTINLPRHR